MRIKDLFESDEHEDALEKTGYWGAQGAGVLFMAKSTGRILFSLRSAYVLQSYTWGLFGGAIDEGEDPAEAAKREASEEAGETGEAMLPLYVYHDKSFKFFNFLMLVDEEFEPKSNWETDGHKWVEFGEWPEPLHFGLEALLADPKSHDKLRTLSSKFK